MKKAYQFLQGVIAFLSSRRSQKLEKAVGLALLAASLIFISLILVRSWTELKPYLGRINIKQLVIGQFCIIAALLLGAAMWGFVQRGVGLGFTWAESVSIHMVSAITKYIPGYAWQYMSKAYLSHKQGSSSRQITLAILTEFTLLIASGTFTAAVWGLLGGVGSAISRSMPHWAWLLVGGAAPLMGAAWVLSVPRLSGEGERLHLPLGQLWWAFIVGAVGWIMFASATWFMSRSIYPITWSAFPNYVVALVASVILGIVIVVVPAGLGVREASLAALLTGVVPFTFGIVVGVMVRSSIVFWEVIGLGIGFHLSGTRGLGLLSSIRGTKR